jgi:hypothetical protein
MKGTHVIKYRYLTYVLVNLQNTYDLHNIYRVMQEEGSIFWDVIVSLIVRKKEVHMNRCLILKECRDRAV